MEEVIMGRELRRKQAKKEGKSLHKETVVEKNQIVILIRIIILLVFIFAIIYLLSSLFITKELDWFNKEDSQTENRIPANSILASAIFKQPEEEYYVYFYDFNDEDSNIATAISSKLSGTKVYRVDTSSALNKKYVSEDSNREAKNLDELRVTIPTVIKINHEEIIAYYEKTEIINNLK